MGEKVRDILSNPEKINKLLKDALEKAEKNKEQLNKLWNSLIQIIQLIKDWLQGNYKMIPYKTIGFLIAAIIYFVNPFDVVFDFFPGVGYLDDAAVLGFVLRACWEDIEHFRKSAPSSKPTS